MTWCTKVYADRQGAAQWALTKWAYPQNRHPGQEAEQHQHPWETPSGTVPNAVIVTVSITWIYRNSFLRFPVGRYLGCFQFGANKSSAGTYIVFFFFNMMYVLAFTYMCLGEHMCAALVGMSAHRSRRAGSECGNMFDIRRHHQRVSKTVVGTYAPTSHGGTFRLLHALVNIRNHLPFSIQPFRWDV